MHSGPITSVVVKGNNIYTAGYDKKVICWDMQTGQSMVIGTHKHLVNCLALSNDQQLLASGSADHHIYLFDTNTNSKITTLVGHNDDIEALIFSQCDNYIISSSNNLENRVLIWETKTGKIYREFNEHKGCINGLWTYGDFIISAADDGNVFLWNMHTGDILENLSPYNCDLDTCTGDKNSGVFALGTDNGNILFYDLKNMETIGEIKAHEHGIKCLSFSPTGKYLLSAGYDHQIKVWDSNTKELIKILPSHPYQWERSLCWDQNEKFIYGGSFGIKYCQWDFIDGTLVNEDEILATPSINKIDVDKNGNVVSASDDGIFRMNGHYVGETNRILNNAVGISDDGKLALWGDHSSQVHIFNLETQSNLFSLPVKGPVNIIKYNKHDGKFWVGTYAGYVYRLDIYNKEWDIELKAHQAAIKTMCFTKDYLITGASNGSTYMFDYRTLRKVKELLGQALLINDIDIDNSEKLVATVGRDRGVRVYSIESGCLIAQHFKHSYSIKSVSFDENGVLYAGDYWGNLSIWDFQKEKEPIMIKLANNGISSLRRFKEKIIASSWDGKIYTINSNGESKIIYKLFDQEKNELVCQ
jgi:toxoflavin biosynthesis protein ToxC